MSERPPCPETKRQPSQCILISINRQRSLLLPSPATRIRFLSQVIYKLLAASYIVSLPVILLNNADTHRSRIHSLRITEPKIQASTSQISPRSLIPSISKKKKPANDQSLLPSITKHNNMQSRRKQNPAFHEKIAQMALPLAPLVRITSGEVHPAFPSTLLSFWCLTSEQLDELAHFYHQRTPSVWSAQYPCPVMWGPGLSLEEKRRKWGRFMGLRGCESPVRSDTEVMREVRERGRREEEDELLWRRKGRS